MRLRFPKRRSVYWAVGVPLSCLLLCGLGSIFYAEQFRGQVKQLVTTAANEGLDLEYASLIPEHPLKSEENATELYEAAAAAATRRTFEDGQLVLKYLRYGKGSRSKAFAIADAWRPAVPFLVEASRKQGVWDVGDLTQGSGTVAPKSWPGSRSLLGLSAWVHSRRGNPLEALELVQAGLASAKHIGDVRSEHAFRAQTRSEKELLEIAAAIVSENLSRADVLAKAATLKLAPAHPPSYYFAGEAVDAWQTAKREDIRDVLAAMSAPSHWSPSDGRPQSDYESAAIPQVLIEKARVILLEELLETHRILKHESYLRATFEALSKQAERQEAYLLDGILLRYLVSFSQWSVARFIEREAQERIFRCGIEVLKHKQRTGEYPPTLPDLGEVSRDPFGTGKFRYSKHHSGRMQIYSVFFDGEDNGGIERSGDCGMLF